MQVQMLKPALVSIAGVELTDHNRSPLTITPDRIEHSKRTATGSLRKYYVADKFSFALSWDFIPSLSTQTVDGKAGGMAIRNLFLIHRGPVIFTYINRDGGPSNHQVVFTDCSWSIRKRWNREYWDISIELEEV